MDVFNSDKDTAADWQISLEEHGERLRERTI
jgi:hypothetical protein